MTRDTCTLWNRLLDTPELPALGPSRRSGTMSEPQLGRELKPLLAESGLAHPAAELVRALLLLWHDHLDAAHAIAQGIDNADGSFVHALVHRREPDAWNSKYWWRQTGNHGAFPEIARRAGDLLNQPGAGDLARRLVPGGKWDPVAFVDASDAARQLTSAEVTEHLLRRLQRVETEVMLDYLRRPGR